MSDLISREEVINIIHRKIQNTSDYLQHNALIDVEFKVDELPTVEAVPVVHGKWEYTFCGSMCSVCGYENKNELITRNRYDSPYCPNCGADMRKKV